MDRKVQTISLLQRQREETQAKSCVISTRISNSSGTVQELHRNDPYDAGRYYGVQTCVSAKAARTEDSGYKIK